jgi:hypothetical protein
MVKSLHGACRAVARKWSRRRLPVSGAVAALPDADAFAVGLLAHSVWVSRLLAISAFAARSTRLLQRVLFQRRSSAPVVGAHCSRLSAAAQA